MSFFKECMKSFCPGFFGRERQQIDIKLQRTMRKTVGIKYGEFSVDDVNLYKDFFQVVELSELYSKQGNAHDQSKVNGQFVKIGRELFEHKNKENKGDEQTPLLKNK